jgi:hypothetical protein
MDKKPLVSGYFTISESFPYKTFFFIIGMAWITIGSVFMITINLVIGITFMGIGTAYLAIGLANRDK